MCKWIVATITLCLVASSGLAMAENPARQSPRKTYRMLYTGIGSAMPTSAHVKWLQYNATKHRVVGGLDSEDGNPAYFLEDSIGNFGRNAVSVGGCSIAIANDFVTPGAGAAQARENVVIIDGDVINAGRCN